MEPTEPKQVTAPDLTDFPAFEAAIKAGWVPDETPEPAEGGEKPPGKSVETPKESTSEPAGEPAKVEPVPEPEVGTTEEPKPEEKVETKPEDEGHAPKWFRGLDRQRKREIREARDEIAALRAQLAARPTADPATVLPAKAMPAPQTPEPKEEDFENYSLYLKATAKYHAEQVADLKIQNFQEKVRKQLEAEDLEANRRQAATIQAQKDATFAKGCDEARKRHEDFDEVVFSPDVEVTPLMDQVVHESEYGADMAYFLASHQEEVHRIAVLPPYQQIRELVKIEAQFSGKKESVPETKPHVPISSRPKPATPIGGGNSMAAVKSVDDPEVLRDFPTWERLMKEKQTRSR